jgi:hypothetical protein
MVRVGKKRETSSPGAASGHPAAHYPKMTRVIAAPFWPIYRASQNLAKQTLVVGWQETAVDRSGNEGTQQASLTQ